MTTPVGPPVALRRLTVEEAIRMSEVGILGEGERVELVDGVLVEMSPEGELHIALVAHIDGVLHAAYGTSFKYLTQCTLRLSDHAYRIPDFVVTDAPLFERPAHPSEIGLILEVADSSLSIDLLPKARDYAAFGATQYWVVDVRGRRLVTHAGAAPGAYADVRTLAEGESVTFPRTDVTVRVADLLPPKA